MGIGLRVVAGWLVALLGVSGCGPVALARPAGATVLQAQGRSVVSGVQADNERRRTVNPEGYARKMATLADNPFSFLRGTTPRFYRQLFARMPGELQAAPVTILHGDLHVENFAVVPSGGGVVYGIDDFDESLPGPVSIDLVRCMASIAVAFGEDAGLLEAYLEGYAQGTEGRVHPDAEAIAKVLGKAAKSSQAKMLAKRTTSTRPRQMQLNDKKKALNPEFKDQLAAAVAAAHLKGLNGLPMQDAVQRFGGTASLDLFRYEAVFGEGSDRDPIVEVKELHPSVLSRHLGDGGDDLTRYRRAAAQYQGVHALPVAATTLGSYRFLVRYRPHFKDSVTPEDVKVGDRPAFVKDLGRITGQCHARGSRQAAELRAFVAKHVPALVQTALDMARQNQADWQAFRAGR